MEDPRRNLPSVERILAELRAEGIEEASGLPDATEAVRAVVANAREAAPSANSSPSVGDLAAEARERLRLLRRPRLRPVINATGVILQTNLGRAPLSDQAIAAMTQVATGYSNLEYDLAAGSRGSRHSHLSELLRRTTGAEDGIVVNNNAAAILMALQVFAGGREVIISRGIRSFPMLKCSSERCVCAPQSLSAGTSTSPRPSVSLRMSAIDLKVMNLGAEQVERIKSTYSLLNIFEKKMSQPMGSGLCF